MAEVTMYPISLPALILISTSFLTFTFIVMLIMYRERRGAKQLALLLTAIFIYTFGYLMETVSTDPVMIRIWVRVQYLGIPFIPVTLFNFTNLYFRLHSAHRKMISSVLFLFGLLILGLQFTYPYHSLYYSDVSFTKVNGFSIMSFTPHLFYHLQNLYQVIIMGLYVFSAVRMMVLRNPSSLKRGVLLILAVLIPLLTDFVVIVSHFDARIDYVPFTFFLTVLILMYLYSTDSLFSPIPVDTRFILDTLLDGLLIFDEKKVLLYFNERAQEVIRDLSPSMIGSTVDTLSSVLPLLQKTVGKVWDRPEESTGEYAIGAGDILQVIEVRSFRVPGERHGQILTVFTFRDVSESRKMRNDLAEMYLRIAETNRLKSMVIDVLSHDLRSPFVMMKNLRHLMEEDVIEHTPSLLVRGGQELEALIDRADVLVCNMLSLDIVEAPEQMFPLGAVDPSSILTSFSTRIERLKEKKQVLWAVELEDDLVIRGHEFLVKSILWNMIENAFRFSPPGASASLKGLRKGDTVCIEIFNECEGISDEVLTMFSTKGWGVKTVGTGGEKGSGLGLYASRCYMEWIGGVLRLMRVEGGTLCSLEFTSCVEDAGGTL